MNIKDTKPLCEILKQKPVVVPSVKLFKQLGKQEYITDNWLETTRYEYKKEKIKEDA
jgi:hypothetical protein